MNEHAEQSTPSESKAQQVASKIHAALFAKNSEMVFTGKEFHDVISGVKADMESQPSATGLDLTHETRMLREQRDALLLACEVVNRKLDPQSVFFGDMTTEHVQQMKAILRDAIAKVKTEPTS